MPELAACTLQQCSTVHLPLIHVVMSGAARMNQCRWFKFALRSAAVTAMAGNLLSNHASCFGLLAKSVAEAMDNSSSSSSSNNKSMQQYCIYFAMCVSCTFHDLGMAALSNAPEEQH